MPSRIRHSRNARCDVGTVQGRFVCIKYPLKNKRTAQRTRKLSPFTEMPHEARARCNDKYYITFTFVYDYRVGVFSKVYAVRRTCSHFALISERNCECGATVGFQLITFTLGPSLVESPFLYIHTRLLQSMVEYPPCSLRCMKHVTPPPLPQTLSVWG